MNAVETATNINRTLNNDGYELPADLLEALANTVEEFPDDAAAGHFLDALAAAINREAEDLRFA